MWWEMSPADTGQCETALAAFHALSKWDLIYVDWGWSVIFPLNDAAEARSYLEERVSRLQG
jgi:hypothetical protein